MNANSLHTYQTIFIFIGILFLIFVDSEHNKETRRKRANTWYKSSEEIVNASDKHACRTRYQQTPVEVYARFIAVDQVKFILFMQFP